MQRKLGFFGVEPWVFLKKKKYGIVFIDDEEPMVVFSGPEVKSYRRKQIR